MVPATIRSAVMGDRQEPYAAVFGSTMLLLQGLRERFRLGNAGPVLPEGAGAAQAVAVSIEYKLRAVTAIQMKPSPWRIEIVGGPITAPWVAAVHRTQGLAT